MRERASRERLFPHVGWTSSFIWINRNGAQENIDRKLVPIPKQITSPFFGGRDIVASGKWAMYFVIGVVVVMPTPFTRISFCRPVPVATTVAV